MIRCLFTGTRQQVEARARVFGITRIGLSNPGPGEGDPHIHVIGEIDDGDIEKVEMWFNSDPPEGVFAQGSMLWFSSRK